MAIDAGKLNAFLGRTVGDLGCCDQRGAHLNR
jgi:hypothetical protein